MRRAALLLTVLALGLTAGCGIPAEDQPREVAADDVPFDLLAPAAASARPETPEGESAPVQVFMYSSDHDRLTPVEREVEAPVEAEEVVKLLLEGATSAEKNKGLSTDIPPRTELLDTSLDEDHHVLTIDLSEQILDVQAEGQLRAIAQLVFTATQLKDVERVRFRVEGEPREVPVRDGRLQAAPVSRNQYPELAPR